MGSRSPRCRSTSAIHLHRTIGRSRVGVKASTRPSSVDANEGGEEGRPLAPGPVFRRVVRDVPRHRAHLKVVGPDLAHGCQFGSAQSRRRCRVIIKSQHCSKPSISSGMMWRSWTLIWRSLSIPITVCRVIPFGQGRRAPAVGVGRVHFAVLHEEDVGARRLGHIASVVHEERVGASLGLGGEACQFVTMAHTTFVHSHEKATSARAPTFAAWCRSYSTATSGFCVDGDRLGRGAFPLRDVELGTLELFEALHLLRHDVALMDLDLAVLEHPDHRLPRDPVQCALRRPSRRRCWRPSPRPHSLGSP